MGASLIDGALRIGLNLKHQIDTKSDEKLEEYLQQDKDDKIITERQIYRSALDNQVIDEATFNLLEKLYKLRNRVVHRYVISEITTEEVLHIAMEYDDAIAVVNGQIEALEKTQIELGVGMTCYLDQNESDVLIKKLGEEKHGNKGLSDRLRNIKT